MEIMLRMRILRGKLIDMILSKKMTKSVLAVVITIIISIAIIILFSFFANKNEITLETILHYRIEDMIKSEGLLCKEIKDIDGTTRKIVISNTEKNNQGKLVSQVAIYDVSSGIYASETTGMYVESIVSFAGEYRLSYDASNDSTEILKTSRKNLIACMDTSVEAYDSDGLSIKLQLISIEKNHKQSRWLFKSEEENASIEAAIYKYDFTTGSNQHILFDIQR